MAIKKPGKQKGLSLGKIAGYCGVTRKTILRWVNDDLLTSFTLPSGHHRIMPEEVVRFLRQHGMPIPPELKEHEQKVVLVVDDEVHIRRVICDLLRPYFLVEEAAGGVEACLSMGARAPDLLLLDYRMPDMDGTEVCRQMRKDPRLEKTKIVVVSAHLSSEMKAGLQDVCDATVEKPFSPASLLKLCLTLVSQPVES